MSRIPFDVKWKPQIESGEYKVETRDGLPVRVLCFDAEGRFPVVAMVNSFPASMYTEYGCAMNNEGHGKYDLFLITSEPEMTAFEKKVYAYCDGKTVGEELIKRIAKELLDLARKELESEVLERLEVAYKNQDEVVYENGKREGKAEAMKDLPRWKTIEEATVKRTYDNDCVTTETMLVSWGNRNDYAIVGPECMVNRKTLCVPVVELSKLPGFKED